MKARFLLRTTAALGALMLPSSFSMAINLRSVRVQLDEDIKEGGW